MRHKKKGKGKYEDQNANEWEKYAPIAYKLAY